MTHQLLLRRGFWLLVGTGTIFGLSILWFVYNTASGGTTQPPDDSVVQRLATLEKKVERLIAELTVPEEHQRQLDEIYMHLAKAPTQQKAEDLRRQLQDVVHKMSPFATQLYYQRLVRLNWAIETLWYLQSYEEKKLDDLDAQKAGELLEILEDLRERWPEREFEDLKKDLDNCIDRCRRSYALKEWERLQIEVNSVKAEKNWPPEKIHALLKELETCEKLQHDGAVKKAIKESRQELLSLYRRALVESKLDEFRKELERLKAAGLSNKLNQEEQLIAISGMRDEILRLLLDPELENVGEVVGRARTLYGDVRQLISEHARRVEEERAKNLRLYQYWALRQILRFNGRGVIHEGEKIWGWYYDITQPWLDQQLRSFANPKGNITWELLTEFPNARRLLIEKLGKEIAPAVDPMKNGELTPDDQKAIYNAAYGRLGWKNKIDQEIAYLTTRDGMVKFLLPIQVQLLEPPVLELYQKAWQEGWKKLEDHTTLADDGPDQVYVASQAARVKKKSPEEVAAELARKDPRSQ